MTSEMDLGLPSYATGKLQIHHIDVGQGDAALLISPSGQTALFDDGNFADCTGIKDHLRSLGLKWIDYHFLSHYHSDHLGCIDQLAGAGIGIRTMGYDRGETYSSASFVNYINILRDKRRTLTKGQTVTLDGESASPVRITCVNLNGAGVYSTLTGMDENPLSAVFKITYGAFDEVIGGDLTGSTARMDDVETTVAPQVGPVEVYKVHHHGSAYSSNDNWLNATTPLVGIVSVGNDNAFGHPAPSAMKRLHDHGVKTYWTETGRGVAPDPAWDRVGGTVRIEAEPTPGAAFTVTGMGFRDQYVNR